MSKTVWFINPPDLWADKAGDRPPLGLVYLSAYLKKFGHNTVIWDNNHKSGIPTVRDIVEQKPDYVCIAVATPNYNNAIGIANIFIKLRYGQYRRMFSRKLKLIAGGNHVAAYPDEEYTKKAFDYVVTGTDGEEGLLRIIHGKAEEQVVRSKDIENLDDLPLPDYDSLDMSKYNMMLEGKKAITMSTSRGCVYSCFYCGSASIKKFRAHSPEYVVNHMKYVYDKFGITSFYFVDDIFTFDKNRVMKMMDLIIINFPKGDISIRATTRANLLTQELCNKMKSAGVEIISIGLESGSPKVLKAMRKHETVEVQRQGVEFCYQAGIKVKGFFIFGNPEETWDDVLLTINFAKELVQSGRLQYADSYVLNPVPASPFWKTPEEFGISYTKPKDPKEWGSFYQIGKGKDIKVNIKHPYLSEQQLRDAVDLFQKEVQVDGLTYK